MTKIIAAGLIVLVLFVGYRLFVYWKEVQAEKDLQKAAAAAAATVRPESLSGLPHQLETSLQAAQRLGAPGLRRWLDTYGHLVEDPRKAWIELDYCVLVARDDPKEARRVFANVKKRLPPSSPVYPRLQKLAPTYEP